MGRSTTRKPIKKRKEECRDCKNFIGNRKIYDHGRCKVNLCTTCFRQSKKKCSGYKYERMA